MPQPSELPTYQISLQAWSANDVEHALAKRPLLLYVKRTRGSEMPQQRRVVLFVHGLNSSAATWLTFLTHAFALPELQAFDFALFNYQTSLFSRLIPFQRLPGPEQWARVLASAIRTSVLTQEGYESYVLVGHSMGGLVSKFAIRYLIESDMAAVARLHSLFVYGTPNHGSDRASALGALLSPDLALLRAFSGPLQDLQAFWNSRITAIADVPQRFLVHERAVISEKDYWVAPTSGISSLPERFVSRIASSHTGLLKPVGPSDPRLAWFVGQLQAIQRQTECSLIEIRHAPGSAEFAIGDEEDGINWIQKLFDALFVVDGGAADGVTQGDLFALYYESEEIKDQGGRIVERIPGPMNLLSAIDVRQRVAFCKLENLVYEVAFKHMQTALDQLNAHEGQALNDKQIYEIVLSLFGRRAVKIHRSQTDAWRKVQGAAARVKDEEDGSSVWHRAVLELSSACRDFLAAFPSSLLAEDAAFNEAWATKLLKRYDEAETLFERFCERFPFAVSAPGARDHVDEIRLRIKIRDSGNAPEQQLLLAEYFLKKESNMEEAAALALEAGTRQPKLINRMSYGLRFALIGICLFHEVLSHDIEPEEIAAMIDQYHNDTAKKAEIRREVEAKAPAERAATLLALLDATTAPQKSAVAEDTGSQSGGGR